MRQKPPVTPAVRILREHDIAFSHHLYEYQEGGGALWAAEALGLEPKSVVKTLIMETEERNPLIVLMHGDQQVSTKALARALGVKQVTPCTPATADRHSGYRVGGTSPLGTRRAMPAFLEESILTLPRIYLNGGKRGYLVGLDPKDLLRVLQPTLVSVGIGD